MQPSRAYIVCTSPRTGSGLLCEALWKTERAGRPDEYFNRATAEQYMRTWAAAKGEYLGAALDYATTPNGVLGLKLMAADLPTVGRFVPGGRRRDPARNLDALAALLPPCEWILLTRRDRLRQAISLWKAMHGGAFSRTTAVDTSDAERLLAAFRVREVDRLLTEIDGWNASWRAYFDVRTIHPLELAYEEDLEESYGPGVDKVLTAIGTSGLEQGPLPVSRQPQTDEITATLLARYRTARPRA